MNADFSFYFCAESDMHHWLMKAAPLFQFGAICYLNGHLGAGKTSFSRGLLRGLGFSGAVKSPTYTLLEVYELGKTIVCHFDLYRLADPEELLYIGADDYESDDSLWLVEWPNKGGGFLPKADVDIYLSSSKIEEANISASDEIISDGSREGGRHIYIKSHTQRGHNIIAGLRGL